jgi:hypothetical protein
MTWTLTDPQTAAVYTFSPGPNKGGEPTYEKDPKLAESPLDVPFLVFGQDKVMTISLSGDLTTQAQYNALRDWAAKPYPVVLTDYLGRSISIYITDYQPKRIRHAGAPWFHQWTLAANVVSLTDV